MPFKKPFHLLMYRFICAAAHMLLRHKWEGQRQPIGVIWFSTSMWASETELSAPGWYQAHLPDEISLATDNLFYRSKHFRFLHFSQVYYFLIVQVEHWRETYRWQSIISTTRNRKQLCTIYLERGSSNTKKSGGAPGPSLKSKEKESQYTNGLWQKGYRSVW